MLTFRLANAEDARKWIKLNREFMAFEMTDDAPWGDAAGISDEEFEAIFHDALNQSERIKLLLIEEDGEPVGFANLLIIFSVWGHGNAILMDDLFFVSSARGKGYGKETLRYIERYGKELGCKRLQFYAEHTNPKAMGFYQALGYEAQEINVYVKYFE